MFMGSMYVAICGVSGLCCDVYTNGKVDEHITSNHSNVWVFTRFFGSPISVDTQGLAARGRVRLIRCYLQCIHVSQKLSTCVSTAQAREIWGPAAGASIDCALSKQRKGNLVVWWFKVDFSRQVQGIGAIFSCEVRTLIPWTWS